jgi:hypothetical protein
LYIRLKVQKGRFFDKTDIDKKAKVIVLGPKIAENFLDRLGRS